MEKKSTHQQTQAQANTYNVEWSALSDTQKTQMLLGSTRMLDAEIFLNEFGSFEQPEIKDGIENRT